MKAKIQTLMAMLLLSAINMEAKVTFPAFFSSHMIMQQNSDCKIWGNAQVGKDVAVKPSWQKKAILCKTDAKGAWEVVIHTPSAGGPYSISFNDGSTTTLDDIMMGELWICSGQSNMEMPMKGYKNQPVEDASTDIMESTNHDIRLFTVKRNAAFEPQSDVQGQWSHAIPETVREFSATAYYFGRRLQQMLKVPVGLIVTAWGGSACEAWLNADWLKAFPTVKMPTCQADVDKTKQRCPSALYNGMLHPIIGLRIAGAIWYQGEDNWPRYQNYAELLTTMVRGWRQEFEQGEFPFYYCQIAPYDYNLITFEGQDTVCSAFLREQQLKAESMIPNSGMAVLMDAGLEKGIHPMKKKTAGDRLARLALVKTYGMKGITAESARYEKMEVSNDTVTVYFDRADMWINCHGSFESSLFELAGEDRVFYPAKAWISRSRMLVHSDKVPHPVAVRYAFKDWANGDLFCEDLPVSSFRSDDW